MAIIKFSRAKPGTPEPATVKELNEKVELMKRDLQYFLNNLDERNLSEAFKQRNNLK